MLGWASGLHLPWQYFCGYEGDALVIRICKHPAN